MGNDRRQKFAHSVFVEQVMPMFGVMQMEYIRSGFAQPNPTFF